MLTQPTRWTTDHPKQTSITCALVKMIVRDMEPLRIVERTGFKAFMKHLYPLYQMPTRRSIACKINELYTDVQVQIKNSIAQSLTNISLTTDCWTSRGKDAYMCVTAHWIAPPRKQAVLSIEKLEGSHTASALTERLHSIIDKWILQDRSQIGLALVEPNDLTDQLSVHQCSIIHTENAISDESVVSVSTCQVVAEENDAEDQNGSVTVSFVSSDCGANIKKAIEDGAKERGYEYIPCAAHTIHNVVKDSLRKRSDVCNLIGQVRAIITRISRATVINDKFREIQKKMGRKQPLRLIVDVVTRWNSTYDMLARAVELKDELHELSRVCDVPLLDCTQWATVTHICQLLKPFAVLTTRLSGLDKTMGDLIPEISFLRREVSAITCVERESVSALESMKDILLQSINTRFGYICTRDVCILSTILHPTYKLLFSEDEHEGKRLLLTTMQSFIAPSSDLVDPTEEHTACTDGNPMQKYMNSLRRDKQATQSISLVGVQGIVSEINAYLTSPPESYPCDPVAFWTADINRRRYPHLAIVGLKYASCPVTSVASERVFSAANHICCTSRARMLSETLHKLTFLYMNTDAY